MEHWFWIIIALLALGLEIATVGTLVSIWFSIGALGAYGASLLQWSFGLQLLIFITLSIVAFLTIRPLAKRFLSKKQEATNADRYVGQKMTVTEAITPEQWGAVMIQGVRWSAREVNLQTVLVGEVVEIIALEGAKLLVKKVQ